LRIAQVSPLFESVPPKLYGGTERIVSYLTEELVKQGHDVTLFASGDSVTQAHLVPITDASLRLNEESIDLLAHHILMIERVFQAARDFDIIHWHIDYLHFPVSRRQNTPHITTLHGRLDIPDLAPLYREYAEMPVISISDSQRAPLRWANWQGTVHHGLPEDLYSLHPKPGEYLAFLGRISREKRVDRAIEIAKRVGMPLKIAAKVDKADQEYFEKEIEHLLEHPLVEYMGEIGDEDKEGFLGNAYALLFPIDWPEPFGLVMIEAMACGTPVVAFRDGSVPEVLDDGVTGFICDDLEQAVDATRRVQTLSREQCRSVFEVRFSAARMARDYVAQYERLAGKSIKSALRVPVAGLPRLAPYPLEPDGTTIYSA
jgi:glycosyltransferase involved in cell wall biosynthesis